VKLFGQLIRTAVNVALLPVAIVQDVVMAPIDAGDGKRVGERTRDRIDVLKDDAGEAVRDDG